MAPSFTELYSMEKKDILCHFVITEAFTEGIRSSENYHFHSYYELYAVKKGRMRIAADHREYLLGEGDVAIVPPRVTHYVYDDADSVRTGFLFDFAPSKKDCDGAFFEKFKKALRPICDITVFRCSELYDGYLSSAVRAVESGEPRYAVEDLLFLTIDHAVRGFGQSKLADTGAPKPSNDLLAVRVENYMNRAYASHPDVAGLAEQIGYSVRQTQRVLDQLFGMSFSQLLAKKRVAAACFLLKNTELPLHEIAFQTGFCNSSHLCRIFRRVMGTTPQAYRSEK